MNLKESKQEQSREIPFISKKTQHEQLEAWAKQFWRTDARKFVTEDMIENGKELLLKQNIDWELVLDNIRPTNRFGEISSGINVIEVHHAIIIGSMAAIAKWSMDHPAVVYLSGKSIADSIAVKENKELKTFVSLMQQGIFDYGQMVLSNSYIKVLDFLFEIENRAKHRRKITRILGLLGDGDFEKAYTMVNDFGDSVRRRGQDFSKTTKSSILTPPNPGI